MNIDCLKIFLSLIHKYPIGASTNAEDIKVAHEMALLRHHLTVIKLNLNANYSKEMCVWLNVAQMKVEEM